MDPPREGGSSTRPPWFDGTNYSYWKVRMQAHLLSLNYKVWISVVQGWEEPTHEVNGQIETKPIVSWTKAEQESSEWNFKALSAIFAAVCPNEFCRISSCTSARKAWLILQNTHEGNVQVKTCKLQKLTSEFENLKMNDDEKFDEFYVRLSHIVNSCHNLGEPIPEFKVVRKILRSLPRTFDSKVTAIEEAREVDFMRIEDLVGSLQTYEVNMLKPRKATKNIAFKTIEEDDDDEESDKELELVAKRFMRYMKKKGLFNKNNKKEPQSQEKGKKIKKFESGEENKRNKIKCFECQGYGHFAQDCANKKMKKKQVKVMNATLDDDSSSNEDSVSASSDDEGNFVAFMASQSSFAGTPPGSQSDTDLSNHEDEDSEDEFNNDLQTAYNALIVEYSKVKKQRQAQHIRNGKLRSERDSLKAENEELTGKISIFESDKASQSHSAEKFKEKLEEKNKKIGELEKVIGELNDEIGKLKEKIERDEKIVERMNSSSQKFEEIWSQQRTYGNKAG